MKIKEAIEVLENHNKWRCDNSVPSIYEQTDAKKLTEAIDTVTSELKSDFLHIVSGIKVKKVNHGDVWGHGSNWYTFHCPKCSTTLTKKEDCSDCGQSIIW